MIQRRKFLSGLIALVAAPAVIRVAPLMPISVPKLWSGWEVFGFDDNNNFISEMISVPGQLTRARFRLVERMTGPFESEFTGRRAHAFYERSDRLGRMVRDGGVLASFSDPCFEPVPVWRDIASEKEPVLDWPAESQEKMWRNGEEQRKRELRLSEYREMMGKRAVG